jgi:hypothetical protein
MGILQLGHHKSVTVDLLITEGPRTLSVTSGSHLGRGERDILFKFCGSGWMY